MRHIPVKNGSLSAKMNIVLSGNVYNEDDILRDKN